MDQPFGDIPLFRELQRILASGQGPLNFEIARQIAGTLATQTPDPTPATEVTATFAEAVRASEVLLAGYTRLDLAEPLRVKTIGRATWVLTALDGWQWLLESLADRFSKTLAGASSDAPEGTNDPMAQMVGQVSPLLLGIQTGTVVGHLANDALARHDPPIPVEDDGSLYFVSPNIDQVAADYDLDVDSLRRWIALHEAARQIIVVAVPWIERYYRSLLIGVVESIEIDMGDMERRLIDLQSGGAEALTSGAGLDQMIPISQTERHQRALSSLKSFLAVFDGYAENAADAVAVQVLGESARVDEGMARHRSSSSEGKAMLASVLGIERDRVLETAGQTFCAAVIKLKGIAALNQVWAAPDNLPLLAEIKDPFQWMERVLD